MYKGAFAEFFEITNLGAAPVDDDPGTGIGGALETTFFYHCTKGAQLTVF